MSTAEGSETYPAAGVIVASPATAPVSSPTNFGFFAILHSITSQVIAANDAATSVFKKARPVIAFTFKALPALKPYQPNHNKPVPIAISGMLLGGEAESLLLPTYITEANAAKPAVA